MILSISAFRDAVLAPITFFKSLVAAVEENRRSAQRLTRAIDSCVSIETVGRVTEVAQGLSRDAGTHRE